MGRPKSEEPTEAITIRVKTSVKAWWAKHAAEDESAGKHIARVVTERAERKPGNS